MAKTNPDIQWAIRKLEAKRKGYELYRDYYDGLHVLGFATEKFYNTFGYLFTTLAENLCLVVVNSVRDRLKLTSFTGGSQKDRKALTQIWEDNKLHLRAGRIHLSTLKLGDSYLIVWDNPQANRAQPTIYPNDAFHVCVRYDTETPGLITVAAKRWRMTDGRTRLNLYYADRIESYVAGSKGQNVYDQTSQVLTNEAALAGTGSFRVFTEDNGGGIVRNPYGVVPVFHFANDADIGEDGRSELKDVIPLQDALNKEIADMLVASEFTAMRQRWATGLEIPVDPETGKPDFSFFKDRLWTVADKEVKFGEFEGADLQNFIVVQDKFVEKIARVTGTPINYFIASGGTPPSGESLKTMDARLSAKVYDRQVNFGNTWEAAMNLALLIAGRAGVKVTANFENTEPRDYGQAIDQAVIKKEKLGFDIKQAVKELGYTDKEIAAFVSAPAPPVVPPTKPNGGGQVIG